MSTIYINIQTFRDVLGITNHISKSTILLSIDDEIYTTKHVDIK